MTRPLMQHSIGQLEEIFSNSPTDAIVLKQLAQELEHRKTQRAAALLAHVQQSLKSDIRKSETTPVSSLNKPKTSESKSLATLLEAPTQFNVLTNNDANLTAPTQVADPLVKKQTAHLSSPKPTAEMPLADAYKILKLAPESTWTAIEQNRRRMVSDSNPTKTASMSPEKRKAALANAETINAAYLSIWSARSNNN
jgi:DnaJ-domain-containing protein 1